MFHERKMSMNRRTKITVFLMVLMLFLSFLPITNAEEVIIHNKIKNPEDDFAFPEDAKLLEIYFPEIYDVDANFIRYGDYTMLLDCAGDQWQQVDALLTKLGVEELTYGFLSHPHSDHMYGMQHIFAKIRPSEFIHTFPEDYRYNDIPAAKIYTALHELELPFRYATDGEKIPFGDVDITIMQRPEENLTGNNASAMLKVTFGERSILFTADIQMDAQRLFAANVPDALKADIMKAPHHGYNPVQPVFLNAVDPEMVIITSYPATAGFIPQLKDLKIPYHHTHLGMMKLTTDGHVWMLERSR